VLGDAQSLPSVWRSSELYGRAVGFVSHVAAPMTRGQSSVADIAISDNDERRQEGDYSRSVR
jgi:hypothetical protein